ncbi:MAG TPA: cupredoxin family copper-binding protein [Patescibacteria group bacterium]
MGKIITAVIVVILIALGIYYIYGRGSYPYQQPAAQQPALEQSAISSGQNQGVSVTIKNFSFSPASLTIKAGTTVVWTNQDSVAHTVTFASFDSGNIAPGQTFKHTFTANGTFSYHCGIHPGMIGTIVVQ